MEILGALFGPVMKICYSLFKNYGWAIFLFTCVTKVILMPLSVWVQRNSIKMVQMEPELNRIKAAHYGNKDAIADEQQKLYKKKKYNPLLSLIPLAFQIILLMGVVEVIYHPMNYILNYNSKTIESIENAIIEYHPEYDLDEYGAKFEPQPSL